MSIQQAINHTSGNVERIGIPVDALENLMADDSGNIVARGIGGARKNFDAAFGDFEKARATLMGASDAMHQQMEVQSKRTKESVSRAKDAAAQMTDAMNKITKLVGPDFEKRLEQLERLTNCMERLRDLNETGKLTGVLDALRK